MRILELCVEHGLLWCAIIWMEPDCLFLGIIHRYIYIYIHTYKGYDILHMKITNLHS